MNMRKNPPEFGTSNMPTPSIEVFWYARISLRVQYKAGGTWLSGAGAGKLVKAEFRAQASTARLDEPMGQLSVIGQAARALLKKQDGTFNNDKVSVWRIKSDLDISNEDVLKTLHITSSSSVKRVPLDSKRILHARWLATKTTIASLG